MNNPFKAGDNVTCVRTFSVFKKNQTYAVVWVRGLSVRLAGSDSLVPHEFFVMGRTPLLSRFKLACRTLDWNWTGFALTVIWAAAQCIALSWAVLVILGFASPAHGQTIGTHLASHHSPDRGYNNTNPGMYLRTTDGLTVGMYKNSEYRYSFYAGRTYEAEYRGWLADLTLGGVTGYKSSPLLPMVVPSIATPPLVGGVRVRLAYIPKIGAEGAAVQHLMLERSW